MKLNKIKKKISKMKKDLKKPNFNNPFKSSGDDGDLATGEVENSLMFKLKARDRFLLAKIDKTLRKIKEGRFGECEECGEVIGKKRLLARPTATQCIECKEENEKLEAHVLYKDKSHTKGQEIINNNKSEWGNIIEEKLSV